MKDTMFDYQRAFARNAGLVSSAEQDLLRAAHVAIIGLGGTGGIQAEVLARMGVGHFTICDLDYFEISNINRQLGASASTLGRSKCEVIKERILSINPTANVTMYEDGINPENAEQILNGVDLVMDSLDFTCIRERVLMARTAREKGIWIVNTAPLGFGTSVLLFDPKGLSFEDYFEINDSMSIEKRLYRFFLGISPRLFMAKYFNCDAAAASKNQLACIAPGFFLAAGLAGTEAVRILTGGKGVRSVPHVFQIDARLQTVSHTLFTGWMGLQARRVRRFFIGLFLRFRLGKEPESMFRLPSKPSAELPSDVVAPATLPESLPVETIVKAAMMAPSGDNCQPWKYRWNGEELRITHDEDRAVHVFNRANHASMISLGCVVESVAIASRAHGFEPEIHVRTDTEGGPGALIRFTRDENAKDDLFSALSQRATDRRLYKSEPMAPEILEAVCKEAVRFPECGLQFQEKISKLFQDYVVRSECFVWENRQAKTDLMRWLRLSPRAVQVTRDGMSAENCGIKPAESLVLRLSRNFSIQRILNATFFLMGVRHRTLQMLKASAGIFCVTVKSKKPEDLVNAGRLWLRVWTRLNQQGFSVQPITSPVLPVYALWTGNLERNMSPKYQRLFSMGAEILRAAFGFSSKEMPILMFRTGAADPLPASHRTLRLPVERVFTRQPASISKR